MDYMWQRITNIGSLRLPTSGMDLRKIRILLERLSYVKVCVILIDKSDLVLTSFIQRVAVGLANTYSILENNMVAAKASMDAKQKYRRSPYHEEEEEAVGETEDHYLLWVRGFWFPPSKADDVAFDGKVPPHLFSSPLKL